MALVGIRRRRRGIPGRLRRAWRRGRIWRRITVERLTIQPRTDWQAKVEALGLTYHTTASEPYWDESVCYRFTAAEIDRLEAATNELHRICIEAAGHVIDAETLPAIRHPRVLRTAHRKFMGTRGSLSLHGRFDLRYDGIGDPKMYEYNADTPTSLLEASVAQWYWLEEVQPMQSKADQFNSIHEKLIARWKESGVEGTRPFRLRRQSRRGRRQYALHAGCRHPGRPRNEVPHHGPDRLGWPLLRRFATRERIVTLYKLYPWEWMMDEHFGKYLPRSRGKSWNRPGR